MWRKNELQCEKNVLQGPVVQSIVSLTSSLRVISLTVLADLIHSILIFFVEKMWVAFALQKLLTFFQQRFQHICVSLDVNFNESWTNDVVSFEQLGPDMCASVQSYQSLLSTRWILYPLLSEMCTVKILIRLRVCAGWSESWLGSHNHK